MNYIINNIIDHLGYTWSAVFFYSWFNLLPLRVKKKCYWWIYLEIHNNMSSIAKMSKHPFMDPHSFQNRSAENECGAYWLIHRVHRERMKMQYSSLTPLPRFYTSERIHSLCRIYAFHPVYFVTKHSTHLFTRQRRHDGITDSQTDAWQILSQSSQHSDSKTKNEL